jgi:hypothetical protein
MMQQPDLLTQVSPLGLEPSPPPPRKRSAGCRRDPQAGPGTCGHWWQSCPAKVPNCFIRWLQANREKVAHLSVDEQNEIGMNAERHGWQP